MAQIGSLDGQSGGKPLSAQSLADDFGVRSEVAFEGIRAVYDTLADEGQPEARAALESWEKLASGACGHNLRQRSPAAEAIAACYGLPLDRLRPAETLFAVHTYYAVLVKLLAWQILSSAHELPTPADQLARARSTSRLRREVQRLEAGGVFEGLHLADPFKDDHFSWYTAAWCEPIERMVRLLADRLGQYRASAPLVNPAGSRDLLKGLYGSLFPGQVRHMLGEYYTPDWLARHMLDELGYPAKPNARLVDPACGSGTFLVMAIDRLRAWQGANCRGIEPGELFDKILTGVVGFDLNPLAVLSARANYLFAVSDLLAHAGRVEIPVFVRDSVLCPCDEGPPQFDFVVGNPPWIAWDDLPDEYRRRTKPLWRKYGLFSLSGSEARHGGGKKDLSMLMLYAAADRYLKHGGRLGMVVTQTLFQSKGAGDGFRRFRLGEHGAWIRVLRVDDLVKLRPFPGAANWTSTIVLEKGSRTTYPVPYFKWSVKGSPARTRSDRDAGVRRRRCQAEPIDPGRPTSPWFVRPPGLNTNWARLVGPSDYQAHLGANSGGANGVYWVTVLGEAHGGVLVRNMPGRGRRSVDSVEHVVEPDLLYPLVRWADVTRYAARPSAHLLLVQDVATRRGIEEAAMRALYPKTYAYLKRFAPTLTRRAAYKRYQSGAAFYSMYNVGEYTVAPVKVVWRRMDRRINAAVVEELDDPRLGVRTVIPQETCVLVAAESCDEAHYLCGALNSSVAGFMVTSHSVRGGKGFGTPSMLDFVPLRRFEPNDPLHGALAAASRRAHQAARRGEYLADVQQEIDRLAGDLWGLEKGELKVIRRALAEDAET